MGTLNPLVAMMAMEGPASSPTFNNSGSSPMIASAGGPLHQLNGLFSFAQQPGGGGGRSGGGGMAVTAMAAAAAGVDLDGSGISPSLDEKALKGLKRQMSTLNGNGGGRTNSDDEASAALDA